MPFNRAPGCTTCRFTQKLNSQKLPRKDRNDALHAVMIATGGRHSLARVGPIDPTHLTAAERGWRAGPDAAGANPQRRRLGCAAESGRPRFVQAAHTALRLQT